MYEIRLPDSLYEKASEAAKAQHVSLEEYIVEAVQLRVEENLEDDSSLTLTPEQVDIIRRSQAEIRAGKFLTADQVKVQLAENRAAWLKENSN